MSTFTSEVPTSNRRKSGDEPPQKPPTTTPKSQSHRVFSEEDEIRLLKSLVRATKSSTPPLSPLAGGHFSKSQINDKLRRLRQRYHKLARTKSLIKTPHDGQIYRIARKIWGKKPKIPSPQRNPSRYAENPNIVEENCASEEVGLDDFPVLMGQVSRIFPENAMYREGLKCLGKSTLKGLNEKWMVQRMEEAGALAKRVQLNYEQTRLVVDTIASSHK